MTTAIILSGLGLALLASGVVIGVGWLLHGRRDE